MNGTVRIFMSMALAIIAVIVGLGSAHADTQAVYVDPHVPDHDAIASRIARQIESDDGIRVKILTSHSVDVPALSGEIIIVAVDDVVDVMSTGRLAQTQADEMLQRASNVTVNTIDRIIVLIRAIHAWQINNPVPPAPEPPTDLTPLLWIAGGVSGCALIAFLAVRKRRQYAGLAERVWEPVEIPSVEDYISGAKK